MAVRTIPSLVTDTQSFIAKAAEKHDGYYDYSKTVYTKSKDKVCIICPVHGEFSTTADRHVRGCGCPHCGRERSRSASRISGRTAIVRMQEKWLSFYNYDKFIYTNSYTPSVVTCPLHGDFRISYQLHFHSQNKCPMCGPEVKCKLRTKKANADFIRLAREVHGDKYDYSRVVFRGAVDKVDIICPTHGVFKQSPQLHASLGRGCFKCAREAHGKYCQLTLEDFATSCLSHFRMIEPWKGTSTKVEFLCPEHGPFLQVVSKHQQGQGCPVCKSSTGERLIAHELAKHGCEFEHQADLGLRYCKPMRFDFFLPNINTVIEFDGQQHAAPVAHFGGVLEFIRRQHRDSLKNEFCQLNGLRLERLNDSKSIPQEVARILGRLL